MRWLSAARVHLRALFRRERLDREMDAELTFHLNQQIAENVARGMPRDEARRKALLIFGNVALVREDAWAVWRWRWLDIVTQDFAYAFRCLRRSPGFTLVAVVTLALGIGATTAIFTVVYSVLLHPLPYADAESIVLIQSRDRTTGQLTFSGFSGPDLHDWTERTWSFDALALGSLTIFAVDGDSGYETLSGATVSERFFDVFGEPLLLGQGLTDRRAQEVVISHRLWQGHFGGASDIVGRQIRLNGIGYTVVGVARSEFDLPQDMRRLGLADPPDVWVPFGQEATAENRRSRSYHLVGRLRPSDGRPGTG